MKRKVVQTVYGQSNYSIAYDETKKMLEAHPDITVIAGTKWSMPRWGQQGW